MLQTVDKVIDSDKVLLRLLLFHRTLGEMEDEELIETLPNGYIKLTEKGRRIARRHEVSIWARVLRFFFPRDFMGELKKGMEIGKGSGVAKKLGGGLYELGKATRKKVDPEHKLKIGNQRRKKNGSN